VTGIKIKTADMMVVRLRVARHICHGMVAERVGSLLIYAIQEAHQTVQMIAVCAENARKNSVKYLFFSYFQKETAQSAVF